MNETEVTEKCIEATRREFPAAVVLKHADRSTVSIPDWSVSACGGTCWIENKLLRPGKRLNKDTIKSMQVITCGQLFDQTNGRCWISVFEEEPKQLTIYSPAALFARLYPKLAGPDADGWSWGKGVWDALEVSDFRQMIGNPIHVLRSHGAIRVKGWPYDIFPWLVRRASDGI